MKRIGSDCCGCRVARRVSVSRVQFDAVLKSIFPFSVYFSSKIRWSSSWSPDERHLVDWELSVEFSTNFFMSSPPGGTWWPHDSSRSWCKMLIIKLSTRQGQLIGEVRPIVSGRCTGSMVLLWRMCFTWIIFLVILFDLFIPSRSDGDEWRRLAVCLYLRVRLCVPMRFMSDTMNRPVPPVGLAHLNISGFN